MRSTLALALGVLLALAAGCGSGGSGSGSGGAAAAGVSVPGGPLAAKAQAIEESIATHCLPGGLLVNPEYDGAGNVTGHGNFYDSCIWTGVYVGTEALRFRATGDLAALARMERGLHAMHQLQAITGDPGYVARYYGSPAMYPSETPAAGPYAGLVWKDDTSRDQYVGLMFGYALAWESIADPALRATVREDVRAIAQRLMRDDMEMRVVRNGAPVVHFRLAPGGASFKGKVTPQSWATVDDFPLNLIAKSMPYDPVLAAELENAQWPALGGSDAFHGLVFFRIAASITGEAAFEDHYRNVLIGQRSYLQTIEENIDLLDDLLAGRRLDRVERILLDMNAALSGALRAWLQPRLGSLAPTAAVLLQIVIDAILKNVADAITDTIVFLNDPANRQRAGFTALALELLAHALDAIGEPDVARSLRSVARVAGTIASTNLDELADTMRSYVGENLFHLSAYAVMTHETDPSLRAFYATLIDRKGAVIGDEQNAFFDFVGAAYGSTSDPLRVAAARRSLDLYPSDFFDRVVDNSGLPGLRVSPWPDRFGVVGNTSLDVFPVDRRAPHHFVWQQHPRDIKTGGNTPTRLTHLGYTTAYWIGRAHGHVAPSE